MNKPGFDKERSMLDAVHPDARKLLAFAAADLDNTEAQIIENHVNDCEQCKIQLQKLLDGDAFADEIKEAFEAPRAEESVASNQLSSRRIGQYKLLQRIGIGGMGEVWMAEQEYPVRRRVALKLTHAGVNTKEVIARFEAERQALSMMDHPNIAKVLDAGTAENGNPYFVMELVKGVPLIKFCDDRRLGIRERLDLFVSVCRAVQHAHQKGIIHRDIKPSNILVSLYDGVPVPKVIDFGLAKAMDNSMRLTDKTIFTEFGKIVGTLNYMSPEQAELNALDVDTRTDVYSLGVILYELLTGSTPVDSDTIRNTAFLKVLEIIRESDPPRPSVRLTSSETAQVVSQKRNVDLPSLQKTLIGELDWVVMKALDKNRDRRYDSASNLAEDVTRFLNDEPVLARPASTAFQLKRFVRKNRMLVAFTSAFTVTLVAAVVVSSNFAIRANRSAAESKESAERSDKILKIFTDAFKSTNPEAGSTSQMLARDVLIKSKDSLKDYQLDFEGYYRILETLGDSFTGIGDTRSAIEIRKELAELSKQELGPNHPTTLRRLSDLAVGYTQDFQTETAISLLESIIPKLEEISGFNHIDTLGAKLNLVNNYYYSRQDEKAARLGEETLAQLSCNFGESHKGTMQLTHNMAAIYANLGRINEAADTAERAFKLMKKHLGMDYPDTLNAKTSLAIYSLKADGVHSEALTMIEQAVKQLERKVGLAHPYSLKAMDNLAQINAAAGRFEEARTWAEKAKMVSKENFGENHSYTLSANKTLEFIKKVAGQNSTAD